MPKGHKKNHVPNVKGVAGIPLSLENAVISFAIATAVRRLRGWGRAHNSMLVHVSRFKLVQKQVRELLGVFVYKLKGALADEDSDPELSRRFRQLYDADFLRTTGIIAEAERGSIFAFPEIKIEVQNVLDSTKVWTVNSEADTALDYEQYPNGLTVICVGGDKLSRGLTLEGLTVSYFLRATKMYDTLMQMGRWFGYRPGYKDLCRLYLTEELSRWYQHVVRADEELRGEFLNLEAERRKPSDYGLRVRSHPSLMVTAPAKMAASQELSLDFGGRVSQTIHFFRDPEALRQNAQETEAFLQRIVPYAETVHGLVRRDPVSGAPAGRQPLSGYLYTNVPVLDVRNFLRRFRFHPDANTVGAAPLIEFLDRLITSGMETAWSVVVASGGRPDDAGRATVALAPGVSVIPVSRATKPAAEKDWSEGRRDDAIVLGVLASPSDLVADLQEHEVSRLSGLPKGRVKVDPTAGEYAARSRACKARDPNHCLLVIYVVQPTTTLHVDGEPSDEKPKNVELAPGSQLPIGIAIALPENPNMPSVSYVVNSVKIDEFEAQFTSDD